MFLQNCSQLTTMTISVFTSVKRANQILARSSKHCIKSVHLSGDLCEVSDNSLKPQDARYLQFFSGEGCESWTRVKIVMDDFVRNLKHYQKDQRLAIQSTKRKNIFACHVLVAVGNYLICSQKIFVSLGKPNS